jgi:glycosyltransferase involved in cell wall biosynthesis
MDEFQRITVSIVICTLHNLEGLGKCIASIVQQTLKPDEVIIVHGYIDREIEEIIPKTMQPILLANSIKLKYIKTIRSLVTQRNIGIDNACGDVIIFFDDDVVLDKDYLYFLLKVYQAKWSESIGGVQGTTIEDLEEKPWHPREIFKKMFFLGRTTGKGCLLPSVNPSYCGNPKQITKVDIFSGCKMSFRREILLQNRFDSNFNEFWACDDVELSYRISQKYDLYQTPFAHLHHVPSSLSYEGHKKFA